MNRLLHQLNILNWPIWIKLLAGFSIAIGIPIIILLILGLDSIGQISLQNTEAYLQEIGSRQRETISETFNEALSDLGNFVTNVTYRRTLLRALQTAEIEDENFLVGGARATSVTNLLNRNFIDVSDSLFDSVWLMDSDGIILAAVFNDSEETSSLNIQAGEDGSDSPAFRTGINFDVLQTSQDIVVFEKDNTPVIEVITAIKTQEVTVGYLVAELEFPRLITENLRFQAEGLPAYSFVIASEGTIFAADELARSVRGAGGSLGVQEAFEGREGIRIYRTGVNLEREVLGYYAPLQIQGQTEPRFALITEVDRTTVVDQTADFLEPISFPLTIGIISLIAVLILLFHQLFAPPLHQLLTAIRGVAGGSYNDPLPAANRRDEFGRVAGAFLDMRQQVQNLTNDMSERMKERALEAEATQEISRFAVTQRDLQTLMDNVVELIVQRFTNIYHAQIFLIDRDGQHAILRASTGEAGKKLLARGHRLSVGSVSVVGQATQEGRTVIARDTSLSQVHRRNEFLPETGAELAIALVIGSKIIGALDVQSKQSGSFTDDEVKVLQTMAAQIAIAIENARLYQESVQRLAEIEASNRQATLRAWEEHIASQRVSELSSTAGTQTGADVSDLRRAAIEQGKTIVGEKTERNTIPIAVPIQLRGQTLGAVEWELPAQDFNANKVLLAQELVNRLGVSLDNARLFQESQRATERERLVNTIATRLTQQTDINDILQTAVREVGQALRAPQVNIRLHWEENGTNGNHSGDEE